MAFLSVISTTISKRCEIQLAHTFCLSLWTKVPLKNSALNNNGTCTLQRNLYCDISEITDCKPAEQPPAETTQSSLPVMRTNIWNKKLWNCSCWAEPGTPNTVVCDPKQPYPVHSVLLLATRHNSGDDSSLSFPPRSCTDLSLVLPSISLPIPEHTLTLSNWGDFSSENFTQDWKCLRRRWQPVSCSEIVTN